jgi:carboxymethylenebutenolidase
MTFIELRTADGPMPTIECAPKGHARGAVVVVHEAFGLTNHIANVCERFAQAGWWAIAPALFHRQGSPVIGYDDMPRAMEFLDELDADELRTDFLATFDFLEKCGFDSDHTAVVGFCAGGTLAFWAGSLRELGAAITFYGSGVKSGRFGLPNLLETAPSVKCPWIGFYGDKDPGIPIEHVEELRTAMKGRTHPAEIVRYEDAGHAFHCDARPDHYEPAAAEDAWKKTLNWLDTFVGVARDPEQVT